MSLAEQLARAMASGASWRRGAEELARSLVAGLLVGEVTPQKLRLYARKAMRLGAWGRLRRESRALLLAASRLPRIRSPVLKSILTEVLVEIELHSTRGLAVFYGAIVALRRGMADALSNLRRLITLGVAYMSLPPWYRLWG